MFSYLFNTFLYEPLYNAFIGLIDIFPWIDAGIVVIIFTVLVKLVLFPLSKKSIRSQIEIKNIQVDALKTKYKDNKQELALKTMNLYKEKGINPFAGIFLALIQLPILIALYFVFYRGGLDVIHTEILYSFIKAPAEVNKLFIGIFDITQKSTFLALLVAVGQYLQVRLTLPSMKKPSVDTKKELSFQDELAKSMSLQMKYVLPVFMFFVARSFASIVSLYFITSSVFAIGQELYMRKKLLKDNK
jgi:YidC/Oxa1 family membrane protein insertase